ncbi:hypothetical protein B0J13DRAFT_561590 [Dactylonectria estremocensis]|uniref:Protamine P1 n=1 Tax=Dactylonectria estremocensis TaxID=1079267 RepID=A0A9P9E9L6_9HYPO|nr:hypothetical protein B0J13DRAFT_561590 [Dactylonectria estremocensis]
MRHADQTADVPEPSWEEDTIYCEATCAPDDVLYEGSDDEDYDDSSSRRLRYEAAGQRFLDGNTPLLLTATLKGPFDRTSGWINPWRSKHRTAGATQGTRISPGKLSRPSKRRRNASIAETVQIGPQDSVECHLPSPESLKQAPVVNNHPYLEDDELKMVQSWRTAVQPVAKDHFWAATPKQTESERKRKARGSEWLRKLTSKRRRTGFMDSESISTPIQRRTEIQPGSHVGLNSSFTSVPDPPSSGANSPHFSHHNEGSSARGAEDTDGDELLDSVHLSFSSAPPRLQSPGKRPSPRLLKRMAYETAKELNRPFLGKESLKAAATLSSPVSQRRSTQALPRKSPRYSSSQVVKQSPAPPTSSLTSLDSEDVEGFEPADKGSQRFETQRDESFCFRMPKKITTGSNQEAIDRTDCIDEDTWSGLSSSGDEEIDPLSVTADSIGSNGQTPKLDVSGTPGSGIETNKGLSSDLSSLSSDNFAGFDMDAQSETSTDVVTSSATQATSEPICKSDVRNKQPDDNDASNEQAYEIHPAETEDVATTQDTKEDGSESSGHESDDDKDHSSQASENDKESVLDHKVEPLQPGPIQLLKNSVLRFVPKSSWQRLSSLTETVSPSMPTVNNKPNKSFHNTVSSVALQVPSTPNVDSSGDLQSMNANVLKESICDKDTNAFTLTPGRHASSPKSQAGHLQQDMRQDDTIECDDTMECDAEAVPLSVSQQSPWTDAKLSQFANAPARHVVRSTQQLDTPQRDLSMVASTPAQTHWTDESMNLSAPQDHTPSIDKASPLSALHASTSPLSQMQNHSTPAVLIRATTPEPQFSVKSFASFMSPSPERLPRNSKRVTWQDSGFRLPSTQGILASATKNPWGVDTLHRRVSWAPLPHESTTDGKLLETRGRQMSPPPKTPIADLPISEDAKFHEHFTAVARRTKGLQRLLPTASQRILESPNTQAMANTFLAIDQLRKPDLEEQTDNASSQRESERIEESQEPLDMVEDVIREMGGYLDIWNVDAELDQARKTSSMQMPQLTQSPW